MSPYYFGGGGGGSAYSVSPGGNGGIGGGGGGAVGVTVGGAGLNNGSAGGGGSPGSQTNTPGGNAGANTGGGGGGGSHYNSNNKGGDGGSGIVIIRYKGPQKATGGTVTTVGTETVHTFTSSGTFVTGTFFVDLSGNRNNGTINGATFNSANGGSIVFNGSSQYVSVSSLITGNQSFSWGAWIYPTATGTPVFFGNNSTGLGMVSYWDSANNKVRVGTWGLDRLTSGTAILPSNWGYTFWTWDGTTLTSYTNGIADGTATGFSFNISNLYTTIGNAVNAQYFAGRIAQTLVYNRVLSAAEIMQNYQAVKTRFGL
jgi:hypothetical protein